MMAPSMAPPREALIEEGREWPRATAKCLARRIPQGLEFADMVGAGNLALCKAADNFDPERGVQFSTYAIGLIRGAMLEMIRTWNFAPRSVLEEIVRDQQKSDRPRQNGVVALSPVSLDAPINSDGGDGNLQYADVLVDGADGPETLALRSLEGAEIARLLMRLPEREQLVIRTYYGKRKTFKAIGQDLGISESRVYQLHTQAIGRLRNYSTLRDAVL